MAMKIVKLTFEDTGGGKYKFFTTADQLLSIMKDELFTNEFVDAKSGHRIIHKDEIMNALNMYPTPPEPPQTNQ
jgi:hypothetical protein